MEIKSKLDLMTFTYNKEPVLTAHGMGGINNTGRPPRVPTCGYVSVLIQQRAKKPKNFSLKSCY